MSDPTPATPYLDPEVFVSYLARTRWFGGKGRPFTVTDVRSLGEVGCRLPESPWVEVLMVELTYSDVPITAVDAVEYYQVPLALYTDPNARLDHAFIGWWEDPQRGWVHAYDALHDREAMACWLRCFGEVAPAETPETAGGDAPDGEQAGLVFHRLPGHELEMGVHSTLFSGEQSNSSVAYGEDSLMKVFRKITPGLNPDISVHDVLTRAGSGHVAALYGYVEARDPASGGVVQLAMLQQFLRTASDGWDLALSSVRTLLAEPEVHANHSGGDFAGEAARLGEALREVHHVLAEHFPAETRPAQAAVDLAATMRARLDAALGVVPQLAAYASGLRAVFDRVAALGGLEVQQVHGDLHLGQTLRTALGWKIVDFEGEPAKTLAERQLPDSRWRDVAGMLRSFDYAPRVIERSQVDYDPESADYLATRADEWAHRSRNHFLTAYADGQVSEEHQVLLDAYVADKAVYETVYETRNRPGWVAIPLQAVARIGES